MKPNSEKSDESGIKTFRFRKSTIEGLKKLTESINEQLNIKLSMNSLVELLIKDAIYGDEKRILKMIKKID